MAANTKGHGIDVICAENNTAQHCALHPLTQMHHDKDPSFAPNHTIYTIFKQLRHLSILFFTNISHSYEVMIRFIDIKPQTRQFLTFWKSIVKIKDSVFCILYSFYFYFIAHFLERGGGLEKCNLLHPQNLFLNLASIS